MFVKRTLENYLHDEVTRLGGICYRLDRATMRTTPDRVVIAPGGRVWFVKVKSPDRGLSWRQKTLYVYALRDIGANTALVYTLADIDSLLAKIFNPEAQ